MGDHVGSRERIWEQFGVILRYFYVIMFFWKDWPQTEASRHADPWNFTYTGMGAKGGGKLIISLLQS